MTEFQIVLDAWGEQPFGDMAALKAGGIAGVFIRLNDMNGGHHMDEGFWDQWDRAGIADLLRAPYFVYNPWVNGRSNYDWLAAHAPDCKLIAVDIEVAYAGYSRSQYAAEVQNFLNLARPRWNIVIYTGQWFLSYLSYWPSGDYWWAQYPYIMYPADVQDWTFEELKVVMSTLTVPSNASSIPGVLKLWQCSGDRIRLPGMTRPTDINLFRGTYAELADWMGGGSVPVQEPDVYVIRHSLSDVDVCFTPGSGEMLLMSAVEQANKYGWIACMNGGCGFDYTTHYDPNNPDPADLEYDKTHAVPRTGFDFVRVGSVDIPYARMMLMGGNINPNLSDNPNRGPWSILAFDELNVSLIVTSGLEPNGFTQMEAAQWVKNFGCTDAYLMDSGRSCQIEQNGKMLYWPYGEEYAAAHPGYNAERVPQCIGLKAKGASSVTTYTGKVKASATPYVIVRREDGTDIKHLYPGTDIKGDDLRSKGSVAPWKNYTWMHLTSPVVGWAASQFLDYTVDTVTPPPPPPPPSGESVTVTFNFDTNTAHVERVVNGVTQKGDITLG